MKTPTFQLEKENRTLADDHTIMDVMEFQMGPILNKGTWCNNVQ